jgi:hypothetical protein
VQSSNVALGLLITATFFHRAGKSLYEVGLLLNHSSSGVTAGHAHGYPLALKLTLLQSWSKHVEALII